MLVVGGDDAALQAVLQLLPNPDPAHGHDGAKAKRITLRTGALYCKAQMPTWRPSTHCAAADNCALWWANPKATEDGGRLTGVYILDAEGAEQRCAPTPCWCAWACHLAWGQWRSGAWRWSANQLTVTTETYATSVPGIFAVGDVNTYPGKEEAHRLRHHPMCWPLTAPCPSSIRARPSIWSTPPPARGCMRCWASPRHTSRKHLSKNCAIQKKSAKEDAIIRGSFLDSSVGRAPDC